MWGGGEGGREERRERERGGGGVGCVVSEWSVRCVWVEDMEGW